MSQSPLTIYLLPVGDGDSIVLRFPNGDWGLIDSNFLPGTQQPAALPLLDEMSRAGEKLTFICLTHYHQDHYCGLLHIMEQYQRFCADEVIFLHNGAEWNLRYNQAKADVEVNALAVEQIIQLVERPDTPFTERIGRVGAGEIRLGGNVTLTYLAPSSSRMRSAQRTLLRQGSQFDFNRIGIAFTLQYGESVLLFTDDILTSMWREIKNKVAPALAPDWIKVSHHGARNANPKWLWAWLSHRRQKNRPLHAVISAEGNAFHPHPNVLAEIHRHASVETTYIDSFALQSTIPSASATWAQRATPDFVTEQKTPAETWHTHLHRGRLCHYEVFADGHIRVPHHQGTD